MPKATEQRLPASLKISRILHAGYVFEAGGHRILFDPIFENPFSRNCFAFPSVRFNVEEIRKIQFSAVFISHFHDDHCSLDSLNLLDRSVLIFLYCIHSELFVLIRELGFHNVNKLELGVAVVIGEFKVIAQRAFEPEIDSILEIHVAGLKVLNVVDALMDAQTLAHLSTEGPWDIVLWPFQTMLETSVLAPSRRQVDHASIPPEWTCELGRLKPRYVVPSSCQFVHENWSWYNHAMFPISYKDFACAIELALPETQVVRMNPSVSIVLDRSELRPAPALSWVLPEGPQDVDYDYQPGAIPLAVSEIAMKCGFTSRENFAKVVSFCEGELLGRYRQLEISSYFSRERIWRLSIYDGGGEKTDFHYRIRGTFIERIFDSPEHLGWFTEVPAAKLYAALDLGETLTSMYLRVNDHVFSATVEHDLSDFEVLEDPLIRVLFNTHSF